MIEPPLARRLFLISEPFGYFYRISIDPLATSAPEAVALRSLETTSYPNPFQQSTTIAFTLPQTARTQVRILDAFGSEVAVLADQKYPAGRHEIQFEGGSLSPGVYFYHIENDAARAIGKLLLMR